MVMEFVRMGMYGSYVWSERAGVGRTNDLGTPVHGVWCERMGFVRALVGRTN